MRQLLLQVPRGRGDDILVTAEGYERSNALVIPARTTEDERDLVLVHVPNDKVDRLLEEVQSDVDLHATLVPRGMLTLSPPADEPPEPLLDVSPRSPIEFLLFGLQSAGSWPTFLAYAVISSAVAWIGLYSGTVYLLTAAMLIAPFAGPAVNTAIGSASGRLRLLRHSIARYFAAIAVGATTAGLMALVFGQDVPTELMVELSSLSASYVLLPLLAGAAGALYLVQTEHSNLISGAAVGMLVAASLAPPTGILGAAVAIADWGMAARASYLITLQLTGINLVAAGVFRYYGLNARPVRLSHGRGAVWPVAVALSGVLFLGLAALPMIGGTTWEQRDLTLEARHGVVEVVRDLEHVELLDVTVRTAGFSEGHLLVDVSLSTRPDLADEVRRSLPALITEQVTPTGMTMHVELDVHASPNAS